MKPGPSAIVVTGVSGAGKTTVGRHLAQQLGWPFFDADDLHSAADLARMRSGAPLGDAERAPWLEAQARLIGVYTRSGRSIVLASSALKRSYRRALMSDAPSRESVKLVLLHTDEGTIAERLAARSGHFFPADLLASQLAAFEPPGDDIPVLVIDAAQPVPAIVAEIRRSLGV